MAAEHPVTVQSTAAALLTPTQLGEALAAIEADHPATAAVLGHLAAQLELAIDFQDRVEGLMATAEQLADAFQEAGPAGLITMMMRRG